MMNLRTIFSATAAATLLVVGPGWALAGPNGRLAGDVVGSASGAGQVTESGVNGDAVAESSTHFEGEFDLGDTPEAPEAPSVPDAPEAPAMPDAPEAPQASVPAADAPSVEAPQGDAPEAPTAPDAPDTPEVVVPAPPANGNAPKGDKGALEKGNGGIRVEGKLHASGSVRGGNPPEADGDADGSGSAEAGGHKVSTP